MTIEATSGLDTMKAPASGAGARVRGRFLVERLWDAGSVLAAVDAANSVTSGFAFQSPAWLSAVYKGLAPARGAEPLGLVVRDGASRALLAVCALVIERRGRLAVARFADLGVSDYNAPLLASDAAIGPGEAQALWGAIRAALSGIDLVCLERMPSSIAGRANPLALLPSATASRFSSNVLVVPGTVEDMLRSRGKKYRKEVERCYRLLEKEGPYAFTRAETPAEIAEAYRALATQQSTRHETQGSRYVLDDPAYDAFYAALLARETTSGFANLFTLRSGAEVVAALFGTVHDGTFTLLRISNGGEAWKHLSPGRLVVVEAMRHFTARGVKRFDMGIGDYAFKRGFGIEPAPLYDLEAALSVRAMPSIALVRVKHAVRSSPRLKAVVDRVRGR